MGRETNIQWCDSTVNPTMGCAGCELWSPVATRNFCYAADLHKRYGGRPGWAPTFGAPTLHPGRMRKAADWPDLSGKPRPEKPWLDGAPRMIFVSDLSDALSGSIPFEYLASEIVAVCGSPQGRRHRWLWLTKRPREMRRFQEYLAAGTSMPLAQVWPDNLWIGTSVTSQDTVIRAAELRRCWAMVQFLSIEPLMGPVQLTPLALQTDWIIVGGMSGPHAIDYPCNVNWIRQIVKDAGEIPVFVKQLGSAPILHPVNDEASGPIADLGDPKGGDWSEWPADLRIRELPLAAKEA